MIGGLVLAAGVGSRFGGPKQVAEVGGRPLVSCAVATLEGAPAVERVLVVAGAHATEVEAALAGETAEVLVIGDWNEGISASLRAGVSMLGGCEAIVVTLGDQPFVTAEVVAEVLERLGDAPGARATYDGEPGHPVVLTPALYGAVMDLRGDAGARDLLDRAGAVKVECGHLADPLDVDTPGDLAAARDKTTKEKA